MKKKKISRSSLWVFPICSSFIITCSWSGICDLIDSYCHSPVSWHIIEFTLWFMSISVSSIGVGCPIGSEGSHQSFHNLIELPSFTCQLAHFNTSLLSVMLAHAYDALLPFLAFKNEVLGNYLSFSTLTHSDSCLWIIRQHCFASKAKLNSGRFWAHSTLLFR